MATRKTLSTPRVLQRLTLFLSAVCFISILKHFVALSALFGYTVIPGLFTIITFVVWLFVALSTEILLTRVASDPVLRHVHSCVLANQIAIVIINVVVNLTLLDLHQHATWAFAQVWVL